MYKHFSLVKTCLLLIFAFVPYIWGQLVLLPLTPPSLYSYFYLFHLPLFKLVSLNYHLPSYLLPNNTYSFFSNCIKVNICKLHLLQFSRAFGKNRSKRNSFHRFLNFFIFYFEFLNFQELIRNVVPFLCLGLYQNIVHFLEEHK